MLTPNGEVGLSNTLLWNNCMNTQLWSKPNVVLLFAEYCQTWVSVTLSFPTVLPQLFSWDMIVFRIKKHFVVRERGNTSHFECLHIFNIYTLSWIRVLLPWLMVAFAMLAIKELFQLFYCHKMRYILAGNVEMTTWSWATKRSVLETVLILTF